MDSESQFVLVPAPAVRPSARTQSGYIALDTTKGPCNRVMKVPPVFFRGAFKSAMRLALQQIVSVMEIQNQLWISRGWKLFSWVPLFFGVQNAFWWIQRSAKVVLILGYKKLFGRYKNFFLWIQKTVLGTQIDCFVIQNPFG